MAFPTPGDRLQIERLPYDRGVPPQNRLQTKCFAWRERSPPQGRRLRTSRPRQPGLVVNPLHFRLCLGVALRCACRRAGVWANNQTTLLYVSILVATKADSAPRHVVVQHTAVGVDSTRADRAFRPLRAKQAPVSLRRTRSPSPLRKPGKAAPSRAFVERTCWFNAERTCREPIGCAVSTP